MGHTYATVMLMAGVTPAFCARQLGLSVGTFLRLYAKRTDDAANRLQTKRL